MKNLGYGSRLGAAALFCFLGQTSAADISFSPLEPLASKEARIKLTVPAGSGSKIQASQNMIDWAGLMTTAAGSLTLTDSFAPFASARFYRAQTIPTGSLVGDVLTTDDGDAVIRPIDHAGFAITWKDVVIYNDVVAGLTVGLGLPKGNLFLISHDHTDHASSATIEDVRQATYKIVAPQAVSNTRLSTAQRQNTVILANGGTTTVLGVQIQAVPAYNGNHPQGVGNGYVITLGGKRLYMSGDTGDIPETRALQNIDVAFLCMNVPYTMTINQAASVTRAFRPKVVYPYHFRNQDNTYANLTSFKTMVGTDFPIEVRIRKWY